MRKQTEITLSGVGGQGMITCGMLLAKAAAVHEHKKATLSSEYGVETRGTFAKSDVIISDNEIYFPDVTKPNIIVCLHQVAYERYTGTTPDSCILIYDKSNVTPRAENAGKEKGIDIYGMAKELGNPATANIITMGIIAGIIDVISVEGAKAAIKDFFAGKSDKVIELNYKAYDMGLAVGKEVR